MPSRRRILTPPRETHSWDTFNGGLDEGTVPYKMPPNFSPAVQNVWLDERPGVVTKRSGYVEAASAQAATTTDNLFSFRKSDGSETLLRSYRSGSMTLVGKRLSGGTFEELSYTGAAAVGTVSGGNLWTETGAHVHDFDDWIKVGDTVIFSTDTATYRAVTAVAATTITVGGAGLTNGAGATFKVRKNLGSGAFVNFTSYKDHAWWVSGVSNFLMAYNGTDVFENPNTWIAGAPAFDTTLEDCPKGQEIAVWNERMFIGNVSDTAGDGDSLLRYSSTSYDPANDPDGAVWNAENEEPIFINDGSIIRSLLPKGDTLWLFKDRRLAYLSGNTPDDWVLRSVDGAQGTRYGRLVQILPSGPLKGSIFWLGMDDFYALQPGAPFPVRLGEYRLRTTFAGLSQSVFNPDQKVWSLAADFAAGTSTNVDLTTVTDAIRIMIDQDVDTAKADFDAGTLTAVDTAKISGSVFLDAETSAFYVSNGVISGGNDRKIPDGSIISRGQTFQAKSYRLLYPRVKVRLKKVDAGALAGTVTCKLLNIGGGGAPLTLLETSATTYAATALTTSYVQYTFEFNTTLNSGQKYAIIIDGPTGDGSNYVAWESGGSLSGGDAYRYDTSWHKDGFDLDLQIFEYETSGNIVSAVVDAGAAASWGNFLATSSANGQTLTFQTRSGNVSVPDGTWSAYATATPGSAIPSPSAKRYIQWKATFSSTKAGDTPRLDDVTIQWSESGTWESDIGDAGTGVSTWGAFNVTQDIGAGGAVAYQIAFSSTSPVDGVGAGTGAAILYQTIVPGQAISSLTTVPAVADRYFIVKASLSTTDPVLGVVLIYDITVNWNEGDTPTALPCAHVFTDRMVLSLTARGQPTPNTSLWYDRNGAWVTNDFPLRIAGMAIFQDDLWLGSCEDNSMLYVPHVDKSLSDISSGINAIMQSPSFDFGERDVLKNFYKVIISCEKKSYGTQLTIDYAIDDDIDAGTWSNSFSVDLAGTYGEMNEHIPFPFGTKGKRIAYRLRHAVDQADFAFTKLTTVYELLTHVPVNF